MRVSPLSSLTLHWMLNLFFLFHIQIFLFHTAAALRDGRQHKCISFRILLSEQRPETRSNTFFSFWKLIHRFRTWKLRKNGEEIRKKYPKPNFQYFIWWWLEWNRGTKRWKTKIYIYFQSTLDKVLFTTQQNVFTKPTEELL